MNKYKIGISQSVSMLNDSSQQNRFNASPILEKKLNKPLSEKTLGLGFEEDKIKKINSIYNKQLIAKKMNKIVNEKNKDSDLNKGLLGSADFKINSSYGQTLSTNDNIQIKNIIKNLKDEGLFPKVKKQEEDQKLNKINSSNPSYPVTEHKSQISLTSNPYVKNIQDFKKMKSVQQQNIQKINENIQRLAALQDNLKKGNLEFFGNADNSQSNPTKCNNIVSVSSEKKTRQEKQINQQNLNQYQINPSQQYYHNSHSQYQQLQQQPSNQISNNLMQTTFNSQSLPQISYKKHPSEIIKPYLSKQNLKVQINQQKAAILVSNINKLESKLRCQSSTYISGPKDSLYEQLEKNLQKQQIPLNQKKSYNTYNHFLRGDQSNIMASQKEVIVLNEEEIKLYGSRCPEGYQKIEILGKGGFSVVWLCQSLKTQQRVAVKQIVNKNNSECIQRELKLLQTFYNDDGKPKSQYQNDQRLKYLIGLVEIIKDQKDTWIVFELGGITSSKQFYSLNGDFHNNERIYKINFQQSYYEFVNLENNLLVQYIQKVASALSLLSENKLVHCDIKPENILVSFQSEANKCKLEQVSLIDFGSVLSYNEKGTINLATIEYMPPEVISEIINENNHTKNNNHTMIQNLQGYLDTIDVWSFGASLLEILTGIPQWLSYKCRVQYKEKSVIKTGLFSIRNQDYEKLLQKQKSINEILPTYLINILPQFDNQEKGELLLDLIIQMLKFNPQERIKPQDILKHPFINSQCSKAQKDKSKSNVQEMFNKDQNQNQGQQLENPNQLKNLLNQSKENYLSQRQIINSDNNNNKSRSQSVENNQETTKYYYDRKFVIKSLNKKSFNDFSHISKNDRNKSSILINQDYHMKCAADSTVFSPNISIQEIETSRIQSKQYSPVKLVN